MQQIDDLFICIAIIKHKLKYRSASALDWSFLTYTYIYELHHFSIILYITFFIFVNCKNKIKIKVRNEKYSLYILNLLLSV